MASVEPLQEHRRKNVETTAGARFLSICSYAAVIACGLAVGAFIGMIAAFLLGFISITC